MRSQILMLKFETGSLFFVRLNIGSQNLNFQISQFIKIEKPNFRVKICKWKPIFCASENGNQILKFWRNQLYKESRNQIFVLNLKLEAYLCLFLKTGNQILNFKRSHSLKTEKFLQFIVKTWSLMFLFSKKKRAA